MTTRQWRFRVSLAIRAAVALVLQIWVLFASSLWNFVGGLVVGVLIGVGLEALLLVMVPVGVQHYLSGVPVWIVPLTGIAVLGLGWLAVVRGPDPVGVSLFGSAYEPDPMFDDVTAPRAVDRLAARADVAPPEVRYCKTEDPLCLTVGCDAEPAILVSEVLLEQLSDEELEAVLAHEIAHLANRDIWLLQAVLAPLEGISEPAELEARDALNPLVLALEFWRRSTWFCGMYAVGLFSRGREYAADAMAAEFTGNPTTLASALESISAATAGTPDDDLRERSRSVDATSVYPTVAPAENDGVNYYSTHPSVEHRIERLHEMVDE